MGLIPVTEDLAITLAALHIQVTHGDYSKENKILQSSQFLHWYVPLKLMEQSSTSNGEWIKNVRKAHKLLSGKSADSCKLDYIQAIQNLPHYGARYIGSKYFS